MMPGAEAKRSDLCPRLYSAEYGLFSNSTWINYLGDSEKSTYKTTGTNDLHFCDWGTKVEQEVKIRGHFPELENCCLSHNTDNYSRKQ